MQTATHDMKVFSRLYLTTDQTTVSSWIIRIILNDTTILRRFIDKGASALRIGAENPFRHRLQDEAAVFLGLPEFLGSLRQQVFQMRLVTRQFRFIPAGDSGAPAPCRRSAYFRLSGSSQGSQVLSAGQIYGIFMQRCIHASTPGEAPKMRMLFDNHHQHRLIVIGRASHGVPGQIIDNPFEDAGRVIGVGSSKLL